MKVSDLAHWEKNPRTATPSKGRILGKTLTRFGDLSGIVFNVRNKRLVSGHQRAKFLESAEIQIDEKLNEPDHQGTVARGYAVLGNEKYTYREVDFCEEDHGLAAIAANNGTGQWHFPTLKDLVLELDTGKVDIELTGFEMPEIENMLGTVKLPETQEPVSTDLKFVLSVECGTEEEMQNLFKELSLKGYAVKVK
jgi:hypothetical protein